MNTVLIADDHPIFRQGLKAVLSASPGIEVVGEAGDGLDALNLTCELRPDTLLLDLEMPEMDGLSVLKNLSAQDVSVACIILTSYDDESYMEHALHLGARGFVLKDEAAECLIDALQTVAAGDTFISPSLGQSCRISPGAVDTGLLDQLTETEKKVLHQVAAFKTSKEIARDMGLSHRTVQTHRSNICKKLGLKGANQLMQFARRCYSA